MTRKLTGDHNQCPGCGLYFNSTHAFDKHRAGAFGVDRRCRTPDEMLAVGMVENAGGWWITGAMPSSVRDARSGDRPSVDT
jgi:hypothetical protein